MVNDYKSCLLNNTKEKDISNMQGQSIIELYDKTL